MCSKRKKCWTWLNTHWSLHVRWANRLLMSLFAWHVSQLIFWLLIFCQTRFSNVSFYRFIESTKPNMLLDLVLAVDPFWSQHPSSSLIDDHIHREKQQNFHFKVKEKEDRMTHAWLIPHCLILCPISSHHCHLQPSPFWLCVHVKRCGLQILSDRLVVIQLEEEAALRYRLP